LESLHFLLDYYQNLTQHQQLLIQRQQLLPDPQVTH